MCAHKELPAAGERGVSWLRFPVTQFLKVTVTVSCCSTLIHPAGFCAKDNLIYPNTYWKMSYTCTYMSSYLLWGKKNRSVCVAVSQEYSKVNPKFLCCMSSGTVSQMCRTTGAGPHLPSLWHSLVLEIFHRVNPDNDVIWVSRRTGHLTWPTGGCWEFWEDL